MKSQQSALTLLAAVALVGLVLTLAGWRAAYRPFHTDDIGNRYNARAVIEHGYLPVTSGLSALNTYTAAGSSWYYIPSVWIFSSAPTKAEAGLVEDVGLAERLNAFLLYLLTIIPLFLLCERISDRTTALLVVILYTVSAVGIFFEHNLWYRARPFAYAWLAWFVIRWFETGAGRFLFASAAALGLGLFINLEMLPVVAGLAFGVWRFRPRFRWPALAAGIALTLVAWTPYLLFQMDRGFIDLRSSLTLQNTGPGILETLESFGDRLGTWSVAQEDLGPFTPTEVQEPKDRGPLKIAMIRAVWAARAATANFRTQHPLGLIPLLLVLAYGLTIASHISSRPAEPASSRTWAFLGLAALVLAGAFNQLTVSAVIDRPLDEREIRSLWMLQLGLAAAGLVLIMRKRLLVYFSKVASRFKFAGEPRPFPRGIAILAAVVIPTWVSFAILSRLERYILGFWVLQLALVAVCLVYLPRYYRLSRTVRAVSIALVILLVLPNAEVSSIAKSWAGDGYAGRRPDILKAAELVADRAEARAIRHPRIGYFFFFGNPYDLIWGILDSRYGGIGSAVHQYLDLQFGLDAVRPPPEGFSANDDFRIVELNPRAAEMPHRFRIPDRPLFRPIGRFGSYEILERQTEAVRD